MEQGELILQNSLLKIYLKDYKFSGGKLGETIILDLFGEEEGCTNDWGLHLEDLIECLLILYMEKADIKFVKGKSWLARVDMWKCLGARKTCQKECFLVKKEKSLVYGFFESGLSLIFVFEEGERIKLVDPVSFGE